MKTILVAAGVGMLLASSALADLVQPAAPSVGTSVRISQATASGASAAALSLADSKTNMQSNFVYYGSLHLSGDKKHGDSKEGDNNNNNNGNENGGGSDGSANGGGDTSNGGGQVPAPAAGVLAMVGLACASLLRRRV